MHQLFITVISLLVLLLPTNAYCNEIEDAHRASQFYENAVKAAKHDDFKSAEEQLKQGKAIYSKHYPCARLYVDTWKDPSESFLENAYDCIKKISTPKNDDEASMISYAYIGLGTSYGDGIIVEYDYNKTMEYFSKALQVSNTYEDMITDIMLLLKQKEAALKCPTCVVNDSK
ncbi:MAG: hypothetical protein LBR22_01450 [Desulfovibrio sp.]|jgi:hypothetical protein|nr:hypothetical protein [Desulfovibrio sp.]